MTFILIFNLLLFVLLSAFCSGSETGIYKLSRVNLRINTEHGKHISIILSRMLEDTNALIFSILIFNNVCNFITTTIATYLFSMHHSANAQYYVAIFITPLLFIFGEVVPKNIFFLRADTLMAIATLPLWAIHKMLCLSGLTPLMKAIAGLFSRLFHSPQTARSYATIRSAIDIISDETKHEGFLSKVQRDIMSRMTNISNTTVNMVMVPLDKVVMVADTATREELVATLKAHPYTRVLVYRGSKKNIIGYVNIYKAINTPARNGGIMTSVKEIRSFSSQTTVIKAITMMKQDKISIAMVTHKTYNLGIITIKDLAEELTGELSAC